MVVIWPGNQWSVDWFAENTKAATEIIMAERELEGFEGKSIDRSYVMKSVIEYWLEHSMPAGVA